MFIFCSIYPIGQCMHIRSVGVHSIGGFTLFFLCNPLQGVKVWNNRPFAMLIFTWCKVVHTWCTPCVHVNGKTVVGSVIFTYWRIMYNVQCADEVLLARGVNNRTVTSHLLKIAFFSIYYISIILKLLIYS